ncbi:hypothetical protein [Streptomyces sp. NBC_00987]|uniref:hypothetical protein n=1 Tax=Streptomyces sp. NBC_00987 TaxID=2903703 RepID=UPI003868D9BD|nr:hypothetical protein OG355_33640 [Streptomyces sp. NBC_00987]
MAQRLTFVLDGRDGLTPVFRRAGESSEDFRRRLQRVTGDSTRDLRAFTQDADGRLRDLRGRFINTSDAARLAGGAMVGNRRSTADWSAVADRASTVGERLTASLISLAPAAIPIAATLAPLAAGAGAVAVATAAFTAALIPQISALTEASEAEKKYDDAVEETGATSEAAVQAQVAYQKALAKLPPETQKAAVALGLLKDAGREWSDSLSGDTMPVFTKSLAIANALLPRTRGLVKGASAELDRMMTLLGGAVESPGFDRLNQRFTAFANGTLRKVDNQLIHLMRTMDTGQVGGGLAEFMDYARAQGPVVADTLKNVGEALVNVVVAGSDVGVSMLDVINGLSGIVAAVPSEAISTILQLYAAIKLAKLAAAGMAAGRAGMAAFTAEIVAMRAAAAAAPSRLAGVTAGIGAMSRTARLAAAGAGIGLLVIGLMELQQMGRAAPPDIDKMTSSLGRFADSGKVAGETARVFGQDLSGLMASLSVLSARNADEFFDRFDKNPVGIKEAKKEVEALDKSLAQLVSNGKADLAAAALDRIKSSMGKAGYETSGLDKKLTDYKEALADAAFEQQLAAQSMGLFGAQAQQVQAKLDAQKSSADGLRQSIQALNDVNRQGLGGMIGFEAAIDATAKAARDTAGALDMSGGKLNLNSEKARNAASALNDLAAKTDEATAAARQSGASWSTVNGIYTRGREKLIASAQAMGLTRSEARALAAQILKTPDKTARLKGNLEDLQAKLASAKSQLAKVPDSRKAAIRAQISDLQEKVRQAKAALATVQSKTVSVMVNYRSSQNPSSFAKSIGGYASGGRPTPGEWAWVGEQGPELVRFKGGETVYNHPTSMGMTSPLTAAGQDAGRGLSAGMVGSASGVEASARRMAAAVTAGVRAELEIASPSRKMKALMADVGKGIIIGLTGTKAKISATAKDLVKDIWKAWEGVRTNKDSKLVQMVNRDTAKLQKLASQRDALAQKIAGAKKNAAEWTAGAREDASLSGLGIEEGKVTAGSIQGGLAEKLAKIKQFTNYIQILGKRGLAKSMLKQILNMGPEQGYAYASALAGASNSTLKQINSLQYSINSQTDKLGKTGADVMYDSGKQAGKGFLTGLTSQQKAIEDQMVKIAKGMQRAIKKALGIKSPSRVMAELGRYSTEGLAVGLTERIPVLDRALGAVTDRVASAQPVIGRPAVVGGGADAQPVQIQIDVHGAMDPVAVGREIQRVLLQLKRTQGVNVSLGVA